jgi:hypothetical protein
MSEVSEPANHSRAPQMIDAELAWDLADIAQGHLDATLGNEIYVAIAVGDAFWAITVLLRTVVRSELGVRADVLPKLLRWVGSYRDHPAQALLRHLIGRVRIESVERRELFLARQAVSATAPRQLPPMRSVSAKLQNLRPVGRAGRPGDSWPSVRRPSAQQRTGSFGYE